MISTNSKATSEAVLGELPVTSPAKRIVFDISMLARWAGPPAGIVRVERELARWARANLRELVFVFLDPHTRSYRELNPRWIDELLAGNVWVDPRIAPGGSRRRRRERIPAFIRPAAMWVLQSRKSALLMLDRVRFSGAPPALKAAAEALQRPLISEKYRPHMFHPDGTRRTLVTYHDLLGPAVTFTADDTLVCAGAPWAHSDIGEIQRLKWRFGLRFAVLCYDIIPLMFPHFYKPSDVTNFSNYWESAFRVADLVVFTANAIRNDTLAYCSSRGIKINQTAIFPLGADVVASPSASLPTLPKGLEAGRYALFVSTIEPRKGHDMIRRVWLDMLSGGLPQRHRFKLVFVGRPGWMVDELLDQLTTDPRLSDSLYVLTSVDDEQLSALYDGAAFCLYPSVYEGYGLPIAEAFARGKAVLASNGGAIPETVDGLAPCLEPHDEEQWRLVLSAWISDPETRARHEAQVRERYRPASWSASAERFFQLVDERR
jgi:glycosyltransferase involved in cell wall biosynthesis